MSKKLKAAVIGTGMGRYHMRGYAANPKVDLVAVCDLNKPEAEEFAKELDVPNVFDNYETMLDTVELDILSVAVPNHLHAPMTLDALAMGINVLCEKPLATAVADGEAMVELAARKKRRLMLNLGMRFQPVSATVAKMSREGKLGDVYYVKSGYMRQRGTPRLDFDSSGDMGRGEWFVQMEKAGGGALMDIGVHILDLGWWLAGCPKPLTISGSTFPDFRKAEFTRKGVRADVDNGAAGIVRCEGDVTILFEATWASHMAENSYCQVFGTKAGAVALGGASLYSVSKGKTVERAIKPPKGITKGSYDHFVDAVLDPKLEMNATGAEGLVVLRMLEALKECRRTGKQVAL